MAETISRPDSAGNSDTRMRDRAGRSPSDRGRRSTGRAAVLLRPPGRAKLNK
jgi:hypothetical protein